MTRLMDPPSTRAGLDALRVHLGLDSQIRTYRFALDFLSQCVHCVSKGGAVYLWHPVDGPYKSLLLAREHLATYALADDTPFSGSSTELFVKLPNTSIMFKLTPAGTQEFRKMQRLLGETRRSQILKLAMGKLFFACQMAEMGYRVMDCRAKTKKDITPQSQAVPGFPVRRARRLPQKKVVGV
jgi:hypothetical protein